MSIEGKNLLRVLIGHRVSLMAYIRSIVQDDQAAEDVFQDVCVLAYQKQRKTRDEAHLMGWLRVTARYESLKTLRRQSTSRLLFDSSLLDLLDKHWNQSTETPSPERTQALRHCLEKLSSHARHLVKLRYVDGMSGEELARAMNRKLNTVYVALSRTHRAFDQFKEKELRRQEELALRQYKAKQRQLFVATGCAAVLLIVITLAWLSELNSRRSSSDRAIPQAVQVTPPVLAHISKSRHARWQGDVLPVNPGTAIRASSLRLEEGLVEMIFTSGAYALLQAPCDIRLETAEQVFLSGGSLAIEIPEDANGFVVRTPTSTVVDYGTEFGVIVYTAGETEAQVYQGKVALRSGSDPVRSEASQMLLAEQAGRVSTDGSICRTAFQAERMFRVIPPRSGLAIPGVRLSLMDMLMAGNGFDTGKTDRMISILDGETAQIQSHSRNMVLRGTRRTQVAWSAFIDYLFVPDGSNGPIQISSEGHVFAGGPDTDGAGRAFIAYTGFLRDHVARVDGMRLGGVDYGSPQHPALAMHANRGISFDLDAIRASLPGLRIATFSALCGISETAGQTRSQGCDFWVLLDGQTVYKRLEVNIDSGTEPISLACPDAARFLSLVVTDGGNGSGFDWGVFAEPVLELASQDTDATPSGQ
jgi:RNA polymerase sigma-70 factor